MNFNTYIGSWMKTNASYLIRIDAVNKDSTLEAKYFNPKAINVETSVWEESFSSLKITLIIRDINYPGSKYTLIYLPNRDILVGKYYRRLMD